MVLHGMFEQHGLPSLQHPGLVIVDERRRGPQFGDVTTRGVIELCRCSIRRVPIGVAAFVVVEAASI